ncbi:Ppx/GppA phosphatase family protein [Actinomadura sp. 21ATH]|uniref:Ppx/GppA phosphatase family protein n=1 Tax=Actinomadura sp. 21ATH TaxID=1735444 RepID=UPI0035C05929
MQVGQPPRPVATVKHPTRLAESIDADGTIAGPAVERLVTAVGRAVRAARSHRVDELLAFATSAVRDATNRDHVVDRVTRATGLRLGFLSGTDEARLTFLASRAWYGWSAGSMLLADIGGGSLEVAYGHGQEPSLASSLPLGAGRLTRRFLPGDPPPRRHVRRLRLHIEEHLAAHLTEVTHALESARRQRMREGGVPVRPVATSRTFFQLARLTGAPKRKAGAHVPRVLELDRLRAQILVLAAKTHAERARLPGVSRPRAPQILAGAIVAETLMTRLRVPRLEICPWAIREGVMIRHLQAMTDPATADTETAALTQDATLLQGPRLHAVPDLVPAAASPVRCGA